MQYRSCRGRNICGYVPRRAALLHSWLHLRIAFKFILCKAILEFGIYLLGFNILGPNFTSRMRLLNCISTT
jgi:hypothetical protein